MFRKRQPPVNCIGLYPKDGVIFLTQASLTSTLELKGPTPWCPRTDGETKAREHSHRRWGPRRHPLTQAPGGRARSCGHLKKSSLKAFGDHVPPERRGVGGAQAGLQGCREGPGNNDSKSSLQTEKILIYVKGQCKWYDNLQSVEGCGPVSSQT